MRRDLRDLFRTASVTIALCALGLPLHADDASRGEALFDLCAQCHGPEARGDARYLAPAIAGLSEWYVIAQLKKFRSGARGTHPDDISGMRMRPMSLTLANDSDLELVARFVAGLTPTRPAATLAGDPMKGKGHFALCAACHGPKAEGNQALNGPPLAHSNDWYLLDQLKKFKAGIRGSDSRDPIAIMMRPMAMALPDEQAMRDVVAYINTLSR
ncbi:MAG: c-type cytochrome [Myxococcota bacterium]